MVFQHAHLETYNGNIDEEGKGDLLALNARHSSFRTQTFHLLPMTIAVLEAFIHTQEHHKKKKYITTHQVSYS